MTGVLSRETFSFPDCPVPLAAWWHGKLGNRKAFSLLHCICLGDSEQDVPLVQLQVTQLRDMGGPWRSTSRFPGPRWPTAAQEQGRIVLPGSCPRADSCTHKIRSSSETARTLLSRPHMPPSIFVTAFLGSKLADPSDTHTQQQNRDIRVTMSLRAIDSDCRRTIYFHGVSSPISFQHKVTLWSACGCTPGVELEYGGLTLD